YVVILEFSSITDTFSNLLRNSNEKQKLLKSYRSETRSTYKMQTEKVVQRDPSKVQFNDVLKRMKEREKFAEKKLDRLKRSKGQRYAYLSVFLLLISKIQIIFRERSEQEELEKANIS